VFILVTDAPLCLPVPPWYRTLQERTCSQNSRTYYIFYLRPSFYPWGFTIPLEVISNNLTDGILRTFRIEYQVLVAVLLLVPCLCNAMLLNILVASVMAVFVQGHQPVQVLKYFGRIQTKHSHSLFSL
jgi:hypothetical protein